MRPLSKSTTTRDAWKRHAVMLRCLIYYVSFGIGTDCNWLEVELGVPSWRFELQNIPTSAISCSNNVTRTYVCVLEEGYLPPRPIEATLDNHISILRSLGHPNIAKLKEATFGHYLSVGLCQLISQRPVKMKLPTIWRLNSARVARYWRPLRIAMLLSGRTVCMRLVFWTMAVATGILYVGFCDEQWLHVPFASFYGRCFNLFSFFSFFLSYFPCFFYIL